MGDDFDVDAMLEAPYVTKMVRLLALIVVLFFMHSPMAFSIPKVIIAGMIQSIDWEYLVL